MPEVKRPVKTMEVDCLCERCCRGYMRPEGYALMTSPPKYPHNCNNCGHSETYKVTYPHLIQEVKRETQCQQ